MRILIIRHGDPNYEEDCLTEHGWKEVVPLADRLEKEHIDYFYVSPYRRAIQTAQPTLERYGTQGVIKDWLHEFSYPIVQDSGKPKGIPWDLYPAQWTSHPENFTEDLWGETAAMASGEIRPKYDAVVNSLDALLAEHGYVREGRYYRAERANKDTIAFFCHFGLEIVLLSHLLNLPLVPMWHGMVAAPTSVTSLNTEEREKGVAYFRMNYFGDASHLPAAGMEASFHARFCEIYDDMTQRH